MVSLGCIVHCQMKLSEDFRKPGIRIEEMQRNAYARRGSAIPGKKEQGRKDNQWWNIMFLKKDQDNLMIWTIPILQRGGLDDYCGLHLLKRGRYTGPQLPLRTHCIQSANLQKL